MADEIDRNFGADRACQQGKATFEAARMLSVRSSMTPKKTPSTNWKKPTPELAQALITPSRLF